MFRDVDKNPPLFRAHSMAAARPIRGTCAVRRTLAGGHTRQGLGGRIHERLIVSVLGAN
jgi:hypothetical protein